MKETTNIGLQKPEGNEYIDVDILNANLDKVDKEFEKVEQPTFDDTGTAEGISSFTDFMEKVKSKMNIFQFFRDFKAGMKYVLHTGRLANNAVTTEEGFALDARMGKVLQDQITEQNNNIVSNYYSFSNAINIPREADLNDMINIGNYTCSANVDVATLKNSPTKQAFSLKIYYSTNSSKYLIQEITTHNDGTKYIRACNNNDNRKLWTEWSKIITNSDLENYGLKVYQVSSQTELNNAIDKIADKYAVNSKYEFIVNVTVEGLTLTGGTWHVHGYHASGYSVQHAARYSTSEPYIKKRSMNNGIWTQWY